MECGQQVLVSRVGTLVQHVVPCPGGPATNLTIVHGRYAKAGPIHEGDCTVCGQRVMIRRGKMSRHQRGCPGAGLGPDGKSVRKTGRRDFGDTLDTGRSSSIRTVSGGLPTLGRNQ